VFCDVDTDPDRDEESFEVEVLDEEILLEEELERIDSSVEELLSND
jgi:hypothetical protein